MKFAVGADEYAPLVEAIVEELEEQGHQVLLTIPEVGETLPWPNVALAVAEAVAAGKADSGVVFCWTGTGVSMAANKVPGVRAALCGDAFTAMGARRWNDANVLALSLRATSETVGLEILKGWLEGEVSEEEDDVASLRELAKIDARLGAKPGKPGKPQQAQKPQKPPGKRR